MSDVTNVRRAEEALAEHRSPDPIDRATVHASLAISRAVRELDTTTRQVNRLVADSVDELAGDIAGALERSPQWVSFDPMDAPDRMLVPVAAVKFVAEDTPRTVRVALATGESYLVASTFDSACDVITGHGEYVTFTDPAVTEIQAVEVPLKPKSGYVPQVGV